MPLSRAPRTPDLERVVQVLSGRPAGEGGSSERRVGWVPERPGSKVGGVASLTGQPGVGGDEIDERVGAVEIDEQVGGAEVDERLEADLRLARRAGLVSVPAALRAGRFAVSSGAVVGVLALVVALGCAFVLRILWAERSAVARQSVPSGASSALVLSRSTSPPTSGLAASGRVASGPPVAGPGTGGQPAPGQATSGAGQPLVVHVVGQVRTPGLVRLSAGARVADAIAAAGGQTARADLTALNLARLVVDGEQIVVPKPGDPVTNPAAGQPGSSAGSAAGAGGGAGGGGLVNLNTADLSALDSLPGVGPVLAQRILDWRVEHGRFSSVDELGEVSGIGDKMLSQLRPKVTV